MTTWPNDGIHIGITDDQYHQPELGVLSNSAIKHVLRSPAHYRAWIEGQINLDSPALRFGRALHCAVLTPFLFLQQYVAAPEFGDCRVKQNKVRRDEWRAANADLIHLSADDFVVLQGISRSVRANSTATKLLSESGQSEVAVRWHDGSVPCKAKLDRLTDSAIIDIKSCVDASPSGFQRSVETYGYHIQAAMYLGGAEQCGLSERPFNFIAVEKTPPFAVGVYTLDSAAILAGKLRVQQATNAIRHCLETGDWPGYADGEVELTLKPWILEQGCEIPTQDATESWGL